VKDKNAIFIVPHELNLEKDSIGPAEKVIFTEEEFCGGRRNSHDDFSGFVHLRN